jgi:hypothetical protein
MVHAAASFAAGDRFRNSLAAAVGQLSGVSRYGP